MGPNSQLEQRIRCHIRRNKKNNKKIKPNQGRNKNANQITAWEGGTMAKVSKEDHGMVDRKMGPPEKTSD